MTIEELKIAEARLWAECQQLEKPYLAKRDQWLAIYYRRQDMELREKLREELRAELAQTPEAV